MISIQDDLQQQKLTVLYPHEQNYSAARLQIYKVNKEISIKRNLKNNSQLIFVWSKAIKSVVAKAAAV